MFQSHHEGIQNGSVIKRYILKVGYVQFKIV